MYFDEETINLKKNITFFNVKFERKSNLKSPTQQNCS